jgi:hypothetical protein
MMTRLGQLFLRMRSVETEHRVGDESGGNVPSPEDSLPEGGVHQAASAALADERRDDEGEPQSMDPIFCSYPIHLWLYDLRANSEARVTLDECKKARWGSGDPRSRLVGVSFSAPRGSTLSLSTFIVNQRELFVAANPACPELRVRLYVHTLESSFSGRADLPSGSSLTIETSIDRTTLVEHGCSSFSVALQ